MSNNNMLNIIEKLHNQYALNSFFCEKSIFYTKPKEIFKLINNNEITFGLKK